MQDGKWRHTNSIDFLLRQWVLWRRWTFYARGESFALKGKIAWESPVHGSSGLYHAFACPIFLLVIGRTSCIRLIHGCSLCAEACAADFFCSAREGHNSEQRQLQKFQFVPSQSWHSYQSILKWLRSVFRSLPRHSLLWSCLSQTLIWIWNELRRRNWLLWGHSRVAVTLEASTEFWSELKWYSSFILVSTDPPPRNLALNKERRIFRPSNGTRDCFVAAISTWSI